MSSHGTAGGQDARGSQGLRFGASVKVTAARNMKRQTRVGVADRRRLRGSACALRAMKPTRATVDQLIRVRQAVSGGNMADAARCVRAVDESAHLALDLEKV